MSLYFVYLHLANLMYIGIVYLYLYSYYVFLLRIYLDGKYNIIAIGLLDAWRYLLIYNIFIIIFNLFIIIYISECDYICMCM